MQDTVVGSQASASLAEGLSWQLGLATLVWILLAHLESPHIDKNMFWTLPFPTFLMLQQQFDQTFTAALITKLRSQFSQAEDKNPWNSSITEYQKLNWAGLLTWLELGSLGFLAL